MAIAQALADVASIAIEQAKGMIAEHDGIDMNDAFSRLRAYAGNHHHRFTEVSESVVAGTLSIEAVGPKSLPTGRKDTYRRC